MKIETIITRNDKAFQKLSGRGERFIATIHLGGGNSFTAYGQTAASAFKNALVNGTMTINRKANGG